MRRVITFNGWWGIDVVMMQRCYNAVFRHIFLSMTFLTCWQIFPDYAAPPCKFEVEGSNPRGCTFLPLTVVLWVGSPFHCTIR